jgi:hypothetical protein
VSCRRKATDPTLFKEDSRVTEEENMNEQLLDCYRRCRITSTGGFFYSSILLEILRILKEKDEL